MPPVVASRPSLADRYAAEFPQSRKLHEQARGVFPHGVTHDGRHLEPFPVYVDRASGSRKWTVEGKELIDYWAGHGALLLAGGLRTLLRHGKKPRPADLAQRVVDVLLREADSG